LNQYAWWGKNSGGSVHHVMTRKPNAWGLFDMLGNVAEWCSSESDTKYDPPLRVTAGANFEDENLTLQDCKPGGAMGQAGRDAYTGFRLAKTGPAPATKHRTK
jgi:formylglycine-generating enzyme required for sulfatase activity